MVKRKQHWVFVHGRESNPVVRCRAGIKIYYGNQQDDRPDLETRPPAVLVFYDTERNMFRIVRLNDQTGIEVGGAEHFKASYGGDITPGSHRFEERPLKGGETRGRLPQNTSLTSIRDNTRGCL